MAVESRAKETDFRAGRGIEGPGPAVIEGRLLDATGGPADVFATHTKALDFVDGV